MKYPINRWNRNRISYIHFGYSSFYDFDNFVIQIMENLKVNIRYSIMLKVNFNEDRYAMLGKQMGFKYSEEDHIDKLEYFHDLCKNMINKLWDDYDVEDIKSIQILYVLIQDMPKLQLKNVNKINFNREFTNVKESRERFNLIPLTIDNNYFGKLIINEDDFTSLLNKINIQRDLLNQEKLSLDNDCKMFLYNNNLIIISIAQGNNVYYRSVYDAKLGVLLHEIKDVIVSDNHFVRTIGNVNLIIVNNKIVRVESLKALSSINYKSRSLKDESNPFIGSWDVEAFEVDGYAKVYALGFKVLNESSKMYYMDNGITSDQLVLQCINDMLVNQYNGYTFYTHNFGKYDSIFLMKILKEENIRLGYEHYVTKELDRGGKMLKLVIKVKKSLSDRKPSTIGARKDPGYNTITIVDSLNILNQSLVDLCNSFEVEVTKGYFPYSFVKKNTLHYLGDTPDYKYWNKISLAEYNNLVKSEWNLKEECLKYLDKDLTSLVMIMNKFSEYINRKYYLQVTDSLTISRLALNIFMKDYLKDSKLPIINKNIFSDIKRAYYGGVTEVYRPYGTNLLHYDVNSLYPFAALNPMPGINCSFIENLDNSIDLKDLFGFFYCEIKTGNHYLGLLPVHHEEGMIMPNGTWKGWYFSEELKYAVENGYTVNVIKGYNFNKVNNVFNDYVKELYKIKSSTNDRVEKDIAKRLLNHLLGRFGLNINKPITKYVNGEELSLLFSTREIIGRPIKITDNDYKVTYNSQIDPDICSDHDIDYIKVQNLTTRTDVENVNEFKDVSLSTAAAVTAYARIYMSRIKLDILNKGGNIYYTDTDSIVTDIPLDESLVGDELGKFKLEYKIKQGYYISNKTYYIDLAEKLWDKRTNDYISSVIKSKTVDSKSLTLDSFKKLYNNQNVEAVKRSSIKDYDKGSVLLVDKNVEISHDAFTKREKIYKRNKWVDTKPLVLDGYSRIKKKDSITNLKRKIVTSKNIASKLLNSFIEFIVLFVVVFLSFITHIPMECFELEYMSDNTVIDLKLEELLELRYSDDYLEEPIETEIYNYKGNKGKSVWRSFFDLFVNKDYSIYKICDYSNDLISYSNSIGYNSTNSDNSYIERPQVLTTVLKHHLDSLSDELMDLQNTYAVSEIKRYSADNLINNALSLCDKAIRGSPMSGIDTPYEVSSPILDRVSVFSNSPNLKLNTALELNTLVDKSSPILNRVSPIINKTSPFLERTSPFLDKTSSPVVNNSPLKTVTSYETTKDNGLLIKNISGYNNMEVVADKIVVEQNTDMFEETVRLITNDKLNFTPPRKYPIREEISPSVLKRFGNVWTEKFNVESPSTIKRYGWTTPAGSSILEEHSPIAKRFGHVFSDEFTLKKNYQVITEHNNVYKVYSPEID